MVSFKELREADFAAINDAAEAWSGVAKALTALEGRVTKDLTSTAQRAGWKGTAADEATKALQGIDSDFKQASAVATAVAGIMKTAATDLAAARLILDTALHDAQGDSALTVTEDGTVRWTVPKADLNDPDAERTIRATAQGISDRIRKAVQQATTADQEATTALQGDIGTSTTAFNPTPYGAGPVADAMRARELMSKGGSLSDDQLRQLQALMATNAEKQEFAATLLNGLTIDGKTGPEALLAYSKAYDGLAHGTRNAAGYQDVYKNLSVVLATATENGGMGKAWEDGLLAAARRPGGSAAGWNDNYPALTKLMAAKGVFDKPFLLKVGNDLVDFERKSKVKGEELWGPDWRTTNGRTDPMGGLMSALSRDPGASKDFFDPAKSKNLDYVLHERTWPNQGHEQILTEDRFRDTSRAALGDALQAATTGRDPHGDQPPVRPHDKVMSQIMDETLKSLAGSGPGDKTSLPAALRQPMAAMIADYAPSMHEILGKELSGPAQPDGLTVQRDQLLRVIRGASEDPASFATIHRAETEEIAARLSGYGPEAFKPDAAGGANHKLHSFTQEAGSALGALDAVFADTASDHTESAKAKADWNARMNYHLLGSVVNHYLGDVPQRLVDIGTAQYANDAKALADAQLQGNLSSHFSAGQNQLNRMIDERAQLFGMDATTADQTGSVSQQLKTDSRTSYNVAIDGTYRTVFGRM
ncbi:WXG100 family type VII secretion target [Kitasatospora sp. NPDC056651]|uniref:WXG100 family type VII secretion target n=1 Tax=Kitasatospora sp. NPDC056651 TaxID=3345892 RepID=UPI0036833127